MTEQVELVGKDNHRVILYQDEDKFQISHKLERPHIRLFGSSNEHFGIGIERHYIELAYPASDKTLGGFGGMWGRILYREMNARVFSRSIVMDSNDWVMVVLKARTEWEQWGK